MMLVYGGRNDNNKDFKELSDLLLFDFGLKVWNTIG